MWDWAIQFSKKLFPADVGYAHPKLLSGDALSRHRMALVIILFGIPVQSVFGIFNCFQHNWLEASFDLGSFALFGVWGLLGSDLKGSPRNERFLPIDFLR